MNRIILSIARLKSYGRQIYGQAEVAKRPTALVLRFHSSLRENEDMTTSGASHLVSSNLTLSVSL